MYNITNNLKIMYGGVFVPPCEPSHMCLYPRLIKNKKYQMYNLKKGETKIDDERKKYVAVGCGHCIECKREKAREWQIRLSEEITQWKYKYFVTLTFSNESIQELVNNNEDLYNNCNLVASLAIRRFLERWRKKYKKSVKHWFITELGHQGTERIHLHGLIFSNEPHTNEEFANIWKYGITYTGDYCTLRTINYIVKYVCKMDADHKGYEPDIFCSAGLGKCYLNNEFNKERHKFKGKDTIQYYTLKNGTKVALPTYYRNKLFTQEERDKLWTYLLDSDKTYVQGIEIKKISSIEGYQKYMSILEEKQRNNKQMGFGTADKEWNEKIYKADFDKVNANKKDYFAK